jgi:imidazolonepropionase-like amidohydrolase
MTKLIFRVANHLPRWTEKLRLAFEPRTMASRGSHSFRGARPTSSKHLVLRFVHRMRKSLTSLAALLCTLFPLAQLVAQLPCPSTLVRAGHVLDPRTGKVLSPGAVLIECHKIVEVGSPARVQAHASRGVKVVDLGSATLLPGLIDGHAHLLSNVNVPTEDLFVRYGRFGPGLLLTIAGMSPSERALMGVQMAREDLESGFTTVRNLGHSGIDGDSALRDAINAGRLLGPRILAAGRKLAPPGGQSLSLNPAIAEPILEQDFLQVESPDSARRAVQENLLYRADVIKVVADTDGRYISPEEMNAIINEAHRSHMRVAVHAYTQVGIQTAIDAGADSIEHGDGVTDEQLKLMRDKGIFFDLTKTLYGGRLTKLLEASIVISPALRASLAISDGIDQKQSADLIQRILTSGVKFAAGSDMIWAYPGKTRGQSTATMFLALRDAGMPPLDIIRSVTTYGAEMLGWQDRLGAIEPGKLADMIAVAGDPIDDISELERVRFVMKDGQVIKNELAPH